MSPDRLLLWRDPTALTTTQDTADLEPVLIQLATGARYHKESSNDSSAIAV